MEPVPPSPSLKVPRRRIIVRGLAGRCPNCGQPTLFSPGIHLRIHRRCRFCGLAFDRGDGFFLGPFVVNYGVTVFGFVVPVLALYSLHRLGGQLAIALAGGGAIVLPVLLYRCSWSWWLMSYFFFLPNKLPANRDEFHEDEED